MKTPTLLAAAFSLTGVVSFAAGDAPFAVNQYWAKTCAACHGVNGKADTKAGKKIGAINFTDPKNQEKFTDAQMFKTIKEGVKDKDGMFTMKPAEHVTDEQIKLLIAHIRAFKQ
jgi:cytochrome c551/c552